MSAHTQPVRLALRPQQLAQTSRPASFLQAMRTGRGKKSLKGQPDSPRPETQQIQEAPTHLTNLANRMRNNLALPPPRGSQRVPAAVAAAAEL